tara:strand:+ start:33 stop:368 length:336 start_codon:yes stop_codon:yes gene_type:complete
MIIYIISILFFSLIIINHLFNKTIETFADCVKMNLDDANCANLIADENKNILGNINDIAKEVKKKLKSSIKTLEKSEKDVTQDTHNTKKLNSASKGENTDLTSEQNSKLKN